MSDDAAPERFIVPATVALIEAGDSVLVFSTLMSLEIEPVWAMVIAGAPPGSH